MERSAAAKNVMSEISDCISSKYSVSQRPIWVEDALENNVATSNYEPLL